MKLTAILLLAAALQVSAKGFGQSVTLSLKNASLQKAITEIEKQTGFSFVYGKEQLAQAKPIDLTVSNEKLERVLELVFKNQPLSFTISGKYIALKHKTTMYPIFGTPGDDPPPPIDIKGRVVNDQGKPVEGAIVTVKGTQKITSTDANGEFNLKGIDENSTLVITGITIETYEMNVKGKAELAINVKAKIITGDEVTIEANTGYQKIKPNEINGSVIVISEKQLNQQTGPSILDRLKDVVPGMYFNTGKTLQGTQAVTTRTNISIRGLGTIEGPLDPLIVLDNFIYEGDLNNINPNDVENITILKDAAASSIWGARAGNGVIVITTKKGRFNQKLRVDVNSSILITEKPNLYSLPTMSMDDFIGVEQYLFKNGFRLADTSSPDRVAFTPLYEILFKRMNGQISSSDSATQVEQLKKYDSRDIYNKYFYRTGLTQQYSINLRGGSGNIGWLFSGNYNKSTSNLQSVFEKINARLENTFRPIKDLDVNIGAYYTNSWANTNEAPSFNSISFNGKVTNYLPLTDNNGKPITIDNRYRGLYTDTAGNGRLLDWKYYPIDDYKHNFSIKNLQELIAKIGVSYNILKYLKAEINYQYQYQWISDKYLQEKESFAARDLVNSFTQLGNTPSQDMYKVPRGGILTMHNYSIRSYNLRGQLNFNKAWRKHFISAILGSEIRQVNSNGYFMTLYGYNQDPYKNFSIDYVNSFPNYITGNSSTIPGQASQDAIIINRFVSLYGNASYSFKEKYNASISLRKDAANILGLSTNDKWNPLWSCGIGWIASKESFFRVPLLTNLKLRASYGYSGNVDLTKTALPIGGTLSNPISGFPITRIGTINNPSLRWEKAQQLNLGIDFGFKNERISGSFDYYWKNGQDLYGDAPFDYSAWGIQSSIKRNVANTKGRGFDLSIRSRNTIGIFKWTTELIASHNYTIVTKIFNQANGGNLIGNSGRLITPVLNKPLYAIAAYKWGGLNSMGDPQGYINGQLSTNYIGITNEGIAKGLDGNIKYFGPSDPTIFGSIINTFTWKGFSLTCNIAYKFGYYFLKTSIDYNALYNKGIGNRDFENRWKKPGDEFYTNIPSMVYTNYPQFAQRNSFYTNSEINVLKGDHLRFQYINLGYTIQPKENFVIKQIQLYGNIANIGILWRANNQNIDPDYYSSLSPSKSFTIGLRARF